MLTSRGRGGNVSDIMKSPTVEDFVCKPIPEQDLDGFHAWKQFGGLNLQKAYEKFCEHPLCCQEDFMFMGDILRHNRWLKLLFRKENEYGI